MQLDVAGGADRRLVRDAVHLDRLAGGDLDVAAGRKGGEAAVADRGALRRAFVQDHVAGDGGDRDLAIERDGRRAVEKRGAEPRAGVRLAAAGKDYVSGR